MNQPPTQPPQHHGRRELGQRLLDALDTWTQDAEEQARKALQLVDDLDEIRQRHEQGTITDDDEKKLRASIGAGKDD